VLLIHPRLMSSFTDVLRMDFLDDELEAKPFKIVLPFTYYIDKLGGNLKVEIPPGFRTDFASVPKLFRIVVPPIGRYGKAAVVHDYLCEYNIAWQLDEQGNWVYYAVSRKEADKIFRNAMEVLGVGKIKRNTMFWGVRLYSIFTFKR